MHAFTETILLSTLEQAGKLFPDNVILTALVQSTFLSLNAFKQAATLSFKLHARRSTLEYVLDPSPTTRYGISNVEESLLRSYNRKRYILTGIAALLMQIKKIPSIPSSSSAPEDTSLLLGLVERYLTQYKQLSESVDEAQTPSNPPFEQSVNLYGRGRECVDYQLAEFWLDAQFLCLKSSSQDTTVAADNRTKLLDLFESERGRDLRNRHLGLEIWNRELVLQFGSENTWVKLCERLKQSLRDGKDGNWHTIKTLVDAAILLKSDEQISKVHSCLGRLSQDEKFGRERGYLLGLIYLTSESQRNSIASRRVYLSPKQGWFCSFLLYRARPRGTTELLLSPFWQQNVLRRRHTTLSHGFFA